MRYSAHAGWRHFIPEALLGWRGKSRTNPCWSEWPIKPWILFDVVNLAKNYALIFVIELPTYSCTLEKGGGEGERGEGEGDGEGERGEKGEEKREDRTCFLTFSFGEITSLTRCRETRWKDFS